MSKLGELVGELRELVKTENGWCALQSGPITKGLQIGMDKVSEILSRYEAEERGEEVEPLAELAARKGINRFQYDRYGDNTWSIYINKDEENGQWTEKEFYGDTYKEVEAAARKYLESLPDKEK